MEINFILSDVVKKLQNMFVLSKGIEREILTNVLLTATDSVTLAATDGRLIQGQVVVGAKVLAPGTVLIPPQFLDFIKAIGDKSQGANLKLVGDTLTLTIDKTVANFAVPAVEQYPKLLAYGTANYPVDAAQFLQALKTLGQVASKDPYDLVYTNHSNGKLVMGTTDNFRLVFFDLDCGLQLNNRCINAAVLTALLALGDDKIIQLGFDGHALILDCADYTFLVETGDGNTPTNVLQFYGKPTGAAFALAELIEKTRVARAISETLSLNLAGTLAAQSNRAEYNDTFKCQAQPGEFVLNAKHLYDALALPYSAPIMGIKQIGSRQLFHIRDEAIQQILIPLEIK